ncbi:lactoylglutathione lyase [Bdellovibrionota bacterium FG-2]
MRYLHTMIRVTDLEKSLHFYIQGLGFRVVKRNEFPEEKFTLVFLSSAASEENAPGASAPLLELTHNWGVTQYTRGDGYGHMAFRVDSVEKVRERLRASGYDLSWGPGLTPDKKRSMAFVDDPDGYEIELLE